MNFKSELIIYSLLLILVLAVSGCDDEGTSPDGITGSLQGVVTDQETGNPVENAELRTGTYSTSTASDGSYLLENIPSGERSIFVEHDYYTSQTIEATIPENDTLTQDIEMMFGGFGKISGTVQTDPSLPATTIKVAVVGAADTFDIAENGQFLTAYLPAGNLTIDIIPADHYFIERITDIEVTRKTTENIGDIELRDLYADRVVEDSCFIGGSDCLGFNDGTYAYAELDGCNGGLIIDLGENEGAVPVAGFGLEMKIGGAGFVSGEVKVSETDSTFDNFVNYYGLPEFSLDFDNTGGSQVIEFSLENSGMNEIRYISFEVDGSVEVGRLYYIKVLNQRNDQR